MRMSGCCMQFQRLTQNYCKERMAIRYRLHCAHLDWAMVIKINRDQDHLCSLQIHMEIMDLINHSLSTHSILCTHLRCLHPICNLLHLDKINSFMIMACNNILKCTWIHISWILMACILLCSNNNSNDLEMMKNKVNRFIKSDLVLRRQIFVLEKVMKKRN